MGVNKQPYQNFGFDESVNKELSNYKPLIEKNELGNIIKETYFKYADFILCKNKEAVAKQIHYIKHYKNNKLFLQQIYKVFDDRDKKAKSNKPYYEFHYNENGQLVKIVIYKQNGNIEKYYLLDSIGCYQQYNAKNEIRGKFHKCLPSEIREMFHIKTQL